MTKIITIPGETFADVRSTAPSIEWIPPKLTGVEALFMAPKYVPASGVWVEPKSSEKDMVLGTFASQTVIPTINAASSQMNGKPSIYFKSGNGGTSNGSGDRTKVLTRQWKLARKKISLAICFANHNLVAVTVTRTLCSYAGADGLTFRFESSGVNSKMAIVVNGTRTELQALAVNGGTGIPSNKLHVIINENKMDIYVNGVLDTTIPNLTFSALTGTFVLGCNEIGSNTTKFHGLVGICDTYKGAMTLSEIAADVAYMTNIYG